MRNPELKHIPNSIPSSGKGNTEVTSVHKLENNTDILTVHNIFNPEKRIAEKFYTQKVLHILFPEVFPDFISFDTDHSSTGYILRKKVVYEKKDLAEASLNPLPDISLKFADCGLRVNFENANGTNIVKFGEHLIYLDTSENLFIDEEDIENLKLFMKVHTSLYDNGNESEQAKNAIIYAKLAMQAHHSI